MQIVQAMKVKLLGELQYLPTGPGRTSTSRGRQRPEQRGKGRRRRDKRRMLRGLGLRQATDAEGTSDGGGGDKGRRRRTPDPTIWLDRTTDWVRPPDERPIDQTKDLGLND